jgi:endonuclease YncB( thermonuclease family)
MKSRVRFFLFLLCALSWPASAEEPVSGAASMRDAVTVAVSGARFRLEGVDPPADGAPCGAQSCIDAAMKELASFVSGHRVTCTRTQRLGHGFFLSSCRLEDGTDAAEHLLYQGFAELGAGASAAHLAAAEQAKAAGRGLWASRGPVQTGTSTETGK